MAIPVNITEANAVVLTLPASLTLDVNDAGTTYTVWYKYTAQLGDNEIGLFFFGDETTYKPKTAVYSPGFPTLYRITEGNTINRPFQIPVVSGQTYTFRITSSTGNVGTALLHVECERFVDQAVPAGSFCINDDVETFPLAIMSPTTGNPIRFYPDVVGGHRGASLNDGTVILEKGQNTSKAYIYSPIFIQVAEVIVQTESDVVILGSNKIDKFYAGTTSEEIHDFFATIYKISKTGTVEQTFILNDSGLRTLDVNSNNTIAYYSQISIGAIKRWDLVNNLPLSDLVAAISTYPLILLKLLSDDTILALYCIASISGTAGDTKVIHYSTTGTVLHTYNLGDLWEPQITNALDDPNSFWLYKKTYSTPGNPTGEAYFVNIKVSDGSVLSTIGPGYIFPSGVYRISDTTPPARFGMPPSCPFWLSRTSIDGGGGGEETPDGGTTFPPGVDSSGIYFINPLKAGIGTEPGRIGKHDSYYNDIEHKIPDPTIRLAYFGD